MKRRTTLSIALALSVVLVSLMSVASAVKAERPQRYKADSGLIKLGPGQKLIMSVYWDIDNDGPSVVGFRRMEYTPGACGSGGGCKLTLSNQTTTAPIVLNPGEAASVDGADFLIWQRIVVVSNRPNMGATVSVTDEYGLTSSTFKVEIEGVEAGS